MSLKVILYDPEEKLDILLRDIFEVTGHELYTATDPEELKETLNTDANLILIPFSERKLWTQALTKKVLIPLFIANDEKEESQILSSGFSSLNAVRIPFNPLELLHKLSTLDKEEDPNQVGLLNALLKAVSKGEKKAFLVKGEKGECCVSAEPLVLCCKPERLREILSSPHETEPYEGEVKGEEFGELGALFSRLLETKEEKKKARPPRPRVATHEEFITVVYGEEFSGVFRKNLYVLTLKGVRNSVVLVNLGSPDMLGSLNKAMKEKGLSLGEISLVLITDFEPSFVEMVRRIRALNPR
ncbi:MAG: hypothetical protein GXO04_01425, partial [Aquificae bacterium]|nr:hypothetical protein [Aquificota bacterium]